MSRKRFLIVGAVGGVLVTGVVIFLMTEAGLPKQSQVLSDGSVLTVRTMTRGNRNRIVEGNLFQRTAGQLLPETWARKLGAFIATVPVDTRLPVLWMERRWPTNSPRNSMLPLTFSRGMALTNRPGFQVFTHVVSGTNRTSILTGQSGYPLFTTTVFASLPGTMPSMKSSYYMTVSDESGTRLDAPVWVFTRSSEYDLMPVLLNALPTDCRTIRLALQPSGGMGRLSQRATFDVPNPSFIERHKWRATPCPIVIERDEFTFCLEHFGPPEALMVRDPLRPDTDLTVEIHDRDAPANHWSVAGLHILNEAGDDSPINLRRYKTRGSRANYFFPGTLSTNLAWKLRFRLENWTFASNQIHTFHAVPLSTMAGGSSEILRARIDGVALVVTQNGTQGQFTAAIVPPDESWRLRLMDIRAPDGKTLKHAVTDDGTSGLSFGIVAGRWPCTNLDLTFGLKHQRIIDILAQPSAVPAR